MRNLDAGAEMDRELVQRIATDHHLSTELVDSLEKSSLTELTFDSAPAMPSDYDSRLSQSELDQLVAYVLSTRNAKR